MTRSDRRSAREQIGGTDDGDTRPQREGGGTVWHLLVAVAVPTAYVAAVLSYYDWFDPSSRFAASVLLYVLVAVTAVQALRGLRAGRGRRWTAVLLESSGLVVCTVGFGITRTCRLSLPPTCTVSADPIVPAVVAGCVAIGAGILVETRRLEFDRLQKD